jgi:ABC-type glycerol-3-phosphate transport system substrate-binding protein
MKRLAALLAALALLAGCGGGGNGGSGGTGTTGGSKAGGEVEDELAHTMGFQQCDGYSVTDLAATYNTEKTPEAVAEAVARTTPAQPEARDSIKQGCLDGLKR